MSWFRLVRSGLVLAALILPVLALTGAAPTASTPKAKADANAKQIARGKYLVTIQGCSDCHTPGTLYGAPDFSRQLSGSEVGWGGPWGVSYAANLTPDKETGMGTWSAKQIVTAIRTGVRPDGTVLQPPMPWQNLNLLTDEDAYAIAAYLQSIPPVSHKVPEKVAPGQQAQTPVIAFPAPGAWDAPKSAEAEHK